MSNTHLKKAGRMSFSRFFLLISVPMFALVVLLRAAGIGQVFAADGAVRVHTVDVFQVEMHTSYQRQLRAVGKVEATRQARMGFERAGTITRAHADEGQQIKAGDLLAELDTQRLSAQIQEVRATISRAKADARLAEISEQRIEKLVRDNLESAQRLDEAREQATAAKAFVTQIEASLERLNVELEKSNIYAPFSGTILSRHVDPGSVVAQGQTIFEVQQDNASEVRIAMGAGQAFAMQVGDEHLLDIPRFDANDVANKQVLARVKSIASRRNINTRTVDVIFELQEAKEILSGDLLSLSLSQTIDEPGVWVPKSALASGVRGLWTLYTVAGQENEQKIVPKSVAVMYSTAKHVYVSGAITDGELVVVQGVHRLVPGQIVNVNLFKTVQLANR